MAYENIFKIITSKKREKEERGREREERGREREERREERGR